MSTMKCLQRIAVFFLCLLLPAVPVAANEIPVWITDIESGETAETLVWEDTSVWESGETAAESALDIGGKGALLMEMSTGQVLYEKNAHEPLPIASVTKIMTLLLIMEAIDNGTLTYTDTLTCSEIAAGMGGSQIWLEPGETMSVEDLLKAVTVVSANDACAMFAEHISGSIEGFVAAMNERAATLGMENTKFLDCSGLNDEAYSCAYDVAVMSRELMKHTDIIKYTTIWMDTLRGGTSQLVNTNKLVRHYSGATGLKTGTTAAAGHNLSATATRDGVSLVAVILGCDTTKERFGGARKLLDYGFANYTTYTPTVDSAELTEISVTHGTANTVTPTAPKISPIVMKRGEESKIECRVELVPSIEAPVEKGQKLGTVYILKEGEMLATYPLKAKEAVKKLSFGVAFKRLFLLLATNV